MLTIILLILIPVFYEQRTIYKLFETTRVAG